MDLDAEPPTISIYDPVKYSQTSELSDHESVARTSRRKEAAHFLSNLYASGTPFFTKQAIGSLLSQIEESNARIIRATSSQEFFLLPGLDGKTARVEDENGSISVRSDGLEDIKLYPFLDYSVCHALLRQAGDQGNSSLLSLSLSYCPLRVVYHEYRRVPGSADVLPWWNPDPADAVRQAFARGYEAWKASEACKNLRDSLEAATILDSVTITKIVAFACSTVASKIAQPITIVQHCLILTLRDILSKFRKRHVEIQCFAQDPMYTKVDQRIFDENGIAVLNDPRAFLQIDNSSIVVSFAPNIPVRQIITDLARPAVLVWDKVHTPEELVSRWTRRYRVDTLKSHPPIEELEASGCDPESSRVRDMIFSEYTEVAELSQKIATNARVYVRNKY